MFATSFQRGSVRLGCTRAQALVDHRIAISANSTIPRLLSPSAFVPSSCKPSLMGRLANSSGFIRPLSTPPSSSATVFQGAASSIQASALLPWGITLPVALLAVTGLVGVFAWLDARSKATAPSVAMQKTEFNTAVMARCPTVYETYRPVPGLTNGHVETIYASFNRSRPSIAYRRECLHMDDGGIVTLDWEHFPDPSTDLPEDAPVLILFPGLTGGSSCSYVLHAVQRARQHGIRAVVFNSRGTADSPVTTPQFYSASFTGDTRAVIKHVQQRRPRSMLLAAGWSLGANILVRYLGEQKEDTPLAAAISMCNPFELTISNANFAKGFNRIYDKSLANGLKKIFAKHELVWRGAKGRTGRARPEIVPEVKTVREFDEAITIHSFGWDSVEQYYAGSSSSLSVPAVRIPLLCIQALDDPIAPEEAIPYAALAANPNCVLVCTPTGGHLGWVSGDGGVTGEPWTDKVVVEWLQSVMLQLKSGGSSSNESSGSDLQEALATGGAQKSPVAVM